MTRVQEVRGYDEIYHSHPGEASGHATRVPLWSCRRVPPLSFPPGSAPSCLPGFPSGHARLFLSCHSRKFPDNKHRGQVQRESSVFFSYPFLHVALLGKNLDSRLKTSGMTEGDIGNDRGPDGREGGHDGGEGVPDFIVIAGSAVLPVLFCHACMVSPPSCLPGFPLSPNY